MAGSPATLVFGGAEEDRTPDLRIANATLSQLSYRPIWKRHCREIAGAGKVEVTRVTGSRVLGRAIILEPARPVRLQEAVPITPAA